MEIIRITWRTLNWFEPLLSSETKQELLQQETYFAVGAVVEETACGIMVLEFRDGRLDIKNLFVAPEYRRRGVATEMIRALCGGITGRIIPICATFSARNEEDACYGFFQSLNNFSVSAQEDVDCSIGLEQLRQWRFPVEETVTADYGETFFSFSGVERKQILQQMAERGAQYPRNGGQGEFVPELCRCIRSGQRMAAAVFIKKKSDCDFHLEYAYADETGEKQLLRLLEADRLRLIRFAELYPQGRIYLSAVQNQFIQPSHKLYPVCRTERRVYEAHWIG